jgi:hypothetical protein
MRRATVVVCLQDHTWREVKVEVVDTDPNYVLKDDEVKERAINLAKFLFSSVEVSFFLVTYVEPLDYIEGIV